MVYERSSSMKRREDHESVCGKFVNVFHSMLERLIRNPRRRNLDQSEYGQRLTARELQEYSDNRNGE
jgi:hypothetical protein